MQVDSYRTAEQKAIFEDWVLTAKFHDYPDGWINLFDGSRLYRRLLLDDHRMKTAAEDVTVYGAQDTSLIPQQARARCKKYRRRILDMSQNVSALHIGGAFSCTEIVDCIYNEFMRPGSAGGKSPDTFLMSKGHGCMIQYVILEDHGVLSKADLDAYCTPHGRLGTHPDYGNPGIEASTGSLGHGLSMVGWHGARGTRTRHRRHHLHGAERR